MEWNSSYSGFIASEFPLDTTIESFVKLVGEMVESTKRAVAIARQANANMQTRGLAFATALIRKVCAIAGENSLIEDIRVSFDEIGLLDAIQKHDDHALFDYLIEAVSYQGISDAVVRSYIEEHGSVTALEIEQSLAYRPSCPKLQSFWQFENCGYRKTAQTCNERKHFKHCPLPMHDLRNGSLNQAAYSLFLFMRDVAGNDFVTWLDRQLEQADRPKASDRVRRLCDAVLEPLRHIHGVSDKVLSMSLASLLLAGDPKRERWVAAGAGMIAIDTLVHNWLHRSGILRRLKAKHAYGPQCYGANGCTVIIERVSKQIDARTFNPDFPKIFPRFVQKAIWNFCSQAELDICNGNRVNDKKRCGLIECNLFEHCDRVALKPDSH